MKHDWLIFCALLCVSLAPSARAVDIVRLHMVTRSVGWAIGSVPGHFPVYRTIDGGRHWENVSPPGFLQYAVNDDDGDTDKASIGGAFYDSRHAWVAVVGGTTSPYPMFVFRTSDGGAHWRQSQFRVLHVGDGVFLQFLDLQHGFLLGTSGPAGGEMAKEVYRTEDGGRHWQRMASPGSQPLGRFYPTFYPTGMTFRNAHDGWITATYHGTPNVPFLHTDNGGRTWQWQPLPIPAAYQPGVSADTYPPQFFGPTAKVGYMMANIPLGNGLFTTQNGGRSWRLLRTFTGGDAQEWTFTDARHGWVVDPHGQCLFRTGDGGKTWQRVGTYPSIWATDEVQLDFVSPQCGWALCYFFSQKSRLYQTRDGGRHWRLTATG